MAKLHLHVKQLSSKYGYRHLPINLQLPDGEVESQRGSLWIAALQMLMLPVRFYVIHLAMV